MVSSVRNSLESQPTGANGNNANRLRDLSLNGRLDQWRVARHMFTAHPVAGEGAGSWETQWLLHEPYNDYNQRPHSLYFETLAELGLIGAVLLALALIPPLASFARARQHPAASAALAAFVVFLVHTGVDWDWQLPAVTVAALLCAACLLGASGEAPGILISERVRWTLAAATGTLVVCAAVSLQGNRLVADAASNVGRGRYTSAVADANSASAWLPWSYQPDSWKGEAELQAGHPSAAARSFREALAFNHRDWRLWLNVARATSGAEQRGAVLKVRTLYPLSPELAAFCATDAKPAGCG
jgi:hypothetical protein